MAAVWILLAFWSVQAQAGGGGVALARPLPVGRAFHGTAVVGDFLFVLGGTEFSSEAQWGVVASSRVMKARIFGAGVLGPWEETTPLPQTRNYIGSGTVVLGNTIFVVGGSSLPAEGQRYNTVLFGTVQANGSVGAWQESRPFSAEGLSAVTALATPGHLHMIGGLPANDLPTPAVWTNHLGVDGSPGEWLPAPPLPVPLWYHSAGVAAGRAYVWGGLTTPDANSVSASIYSSEILANGELGPWREEQEKLPTPFYSASTSVAGPYLISFSPRYAGGTLSNDVWYATATPSGLGKWGRLQMGFPNRVYHSCATDYRRGLVYFGGGRADKENARNLLATMVILKLSDEARRLAEEQWVNLQIAHANTASVIETAAGPASHSGAPEAASAPPAQNRSLAGFSPLPEARQRADEQQQPLVVYMRRSSAKPCQEQDEMVSAQADQLLQDQVVYAVVEVDRDMQLAQQLGVWRVPAWLFYDREGHEIPNSRFYGTLATDELSRRVRALAQYANPAQ